MPVLLYWKALEKGDRISFTISIARSTVLANTSFDREAREPRCRSRVVPALDNTGRIIAGEPEDATPPR